MPLFNISDLTWDDTIYPRNVRSQKTIDAYNEALSADETRPFGLICALTLSHILPRLRPPENKIKP